jgi:hypothetical protein
VNLRPGWSRLPQPVGLVRLSVDNRQRLPPIPFRSALWVASPTQISAQLAAEEDRAWGFEPPSRVSPLSTLVRVQVAINHELNNKSINFRLIQSSIARLVAEVTQLLFDISYETSHSLSVGRRTRTVQYAQLGTAAA